MLLPNKRNSFYKAQAVTLAQEKSRRTKPSQIPSFRGLRQQEPNKKWTSAHTGSAKGLQAPEMEELKWAYSQIHETLLVDSEMEVGWVELGKASVRSCMSRWANTCKILVPMINANSPVQMEENYRNSDAKPIWLEGRHNLPRLGVQSPVRAQIRSNQWMQA